MRIVSYNVRYFGHALKGLASTASSKAKIADAIASLSPLADVVALQEIETRSLRATVAHRGADDAETQLEAFMRHLEAAMRARGEAPPYRAFYYPAHAYRLGALKLYTTGLALLVDTRRVAVLDDSSRAPHEVTHHRTPALRPLKQTRIAAHLRLEDTHGKRLHVFNTHLSLPTFWAREYWARDEKMGFGQNQLEEARAVAGYVDATARGEPFVLVGDFNAPPATPVYRYLTERARLVGAQEVLRQIDAARRDSWSTAGFMHLRMHLDHVFGGNGVEFVELSESLPFGDPASRFHGLSDHVPLVATFGL